MKRDNRVRTWPEGTWATLADSVTRLRNGTPSKIAANRLAQESERLREVVEAAIAYRAAVVANDLDDIGRKSVRFAVESASIRLGAALSALQP